MGSLTSNPEDKYDILEMKQIDCKNWAKACREGISGTPVVDDVRKLIREYCGCDIEPMALKDVIVLEHASDKKLEQLVKLYPSLSIMNFFKMANKEISCFAYRNEILRALFYSLACVAPYKFFSELTTIINDEFQFCYQFNETIMIQSSYAHEICIIMPKEIKSDKIKIILESQQYGEYRITRKPEFLLFPMLFGFVDREELDDLFNRDHSEFIRYGNFPFVKVTRTPLLNCVMYKFIFNPPAVVLFEGLEECGKKQIRHAYKKYFK